MEVRRLLAEPAAERPGLPAAEVAQRDVGVAAAEHEVHRLLALGVVAHDVALALPVPHQPERLRARGPRGQRQPGRAAAVAPGLGDRDHAGSVPHPPPIMQSAAIMQ